MAIPKYDELYSDILKCLLDKKEYSTRFIKENVAENLNLTADEKNLLLPSKFQTVIENRIGWAITYLKKAGLIESKKRGYVNITNVGIKEFENNEVITNNILYKYPSFLDFKNKPETDIINQNNNSFKQATPEEEMEESFNKINNELSERILENILNKDSLFFERLVVDLLLKMGYGEFRPNAGNTTSPTNDGGIDGIINEDRLGIDKIAIQAKRYEKSNKVGTPLIQSFVGALVGKGLSKGVFITTSSFTKGAIDYAQNQSIILINGEKLAQLMIEYNVGTYTSHTYEIKLIDSDYFNIGE